MSTPTFETDLRKINTGNLAEGESDIIWDAAAHIEKLEQALHALIMYGNWQVRDGTDHHPTLPSAVARGEAVLQGRY